MSGRTWREAAQSFDPDRAAFGTGVLSPPSGSIARWILP